jgi:hypothetical protein
MTTLRSLRVRFDNCIQAAELAAFRGAVAARAGWEHTLFHNHEATGGLRYRYPLIQYQRIGQNPALLCLNEGVEAAQHFLTQPDWELDLNGHTLQLQVGQMQLREYGLRVSEHPYTYHLHQWLALNQENYRRYMQHPGLTARLQLLERILTGNLLSMATGLGWQVEAPLGVELLDLQPPRPLRVYGHGTLAFDATFRANVLLPAGLGLGKHASLGHGRLEHPRRPVNRAGVATARAGAVVFTADAEPTDFIS